MDALAIRQNTNITEAQTFSEELIDRFITFLDASPKTVQTYSRAIRQLLKYLAERGINRPTREDIISFREDLKREHKPSTVQNYIVAIRLLFQWLGQEGLYPDIAQHIKGAKITKEHKKD